MQPTESFNDDGDAQVLRKAMKGLGKWGPCAQPLLPLLSRSWGRKPNLDHTGLCESSGEGEKSQFGSRGSSLFPISCLQGGQ